MKKIIASTVIALALINVCGSVIATESINWDRFWFDVQMHDFICNKQGLPKTQKDKEIEKYRALSADGNDFYSAVLGKLYYDQGEYKESLKYFLDFSAKHDSMVDYYIGDMYSNGKGTKVDYDKAIFHFKKAVSSHENTQSRSNAALAVSVAYQLKHQDDKPKFIRRDSSEMKEARMQSAWLYVAHWLGCKEVTIQGTILKPKKTEFLAMHLYDLEKSNDSMTINEIQQQASEICSTIYGCSK